MNAVVYFEIEADEPAAAIRFYEAVFGWTFRKEANQSIDYWAITTEGLHGGLLGRSGPVPPCGCGANAFACSIQVGDFDATAAKIIEGGGRVAVKKFAVLGRCWQGYFLDNQGNIFGIFEVDEAAS